MNNQTTMMNRQLFGEYATDCGIQMAVDIARACGIDAARINQWTDSLLSAMCEDVKVEEADMGYEAAFPISPEDERAFIAAVERDSGANVH